MRFQSHILIAVGLLGAGWLLGASAMPFTSSSAVTLPARVQSPVQSAGYTPVHLEVVNPTLASLELRFDPASNPAEPAPLDSATPHPHAPATTPAGNPIIDEASTAAPLYELHRTTPADSATFDWYDSTHPGSVATGWADGYGRSDMPIPGLNWRTDWNSTFSVQFSHQTWRDSTDIAVLGTFSIDF